MRGLPVGVQALAATSVVMAIAGEARADPELRVQVSQRGGFILIGKSLGHDCNNPKPPNATLGACGVNAYADSGIDVYWRADSPGPGQVEGHTGITAANARTAAKLDQPVGSEVTHAFLYWGATRDGGGADPVVTLDREGGFSAQVDAKANCVTNILDSYQCSADVTAIVQDNGTGQYRVGGVDAAALVDKLDEGAFAAWYMIVLYRQPDQPIRNLAVFDGLDVVASNMEKQVVLDGFLVPEAAKDGRLGVVAYEGDLAIVGDQLFFDGGVALTTANNPANNFFNGSQTNNGVKVSTPGDLPRTDGGPGTLSGLDLDTVDISGKIKPGQTSVPILGSTMTDQYFLAAFVTQITDLRPEFTKSVLAAVDVDGGGLVSGDELEYVVTAVSSGNDDAVDVVVSHALPPSVTYVGGSLEIVSGDNAGALSDAVGDDPGEYDAKTDTVVVRLGAGADAVAGGGLPIGSSSAFKFRVQIDKGTAVVSSQAFISAAGASGASPAVTPTDDDGVGVAAPTVVYVGACESTADCGGGQCVGGVCGTPDAGQDVDWATYAGKKGSETDVAVTVDGAGNIYLAGTAVSTSALATPGTHKPNYIGGATDAFLLKFTPDGARAWGTYIGGTGDDRAIDVAVDAQGNALVAGLTTSSDGVASPGALQASLQGTNDGFLARFTPAGARVWGTYLGSATTGAEAGQAAAFGADGSAHVGGAVAGAFPFALPGPHDTTANGGTDGYWLELDATGGLVRGTYYGGIGNDEVRGVAVDAASVHIAGLTASPTGIATPGAHDETLDGSTDAWVARFQPTGDRAWGTYLGGPGSDLGLAVQRMGGGVAVAGTTNSATGIASPGALQPDLAGGLDAMVFRLDDLGAVVWSTYYGGPANESSAALTRDALGNLLLAGTTASAGIASADGLRSAAQGGADGFILKLDPAGARRWATYYGGAGDEVLGRHAIAAHGVDDIYLTGRTGSALGVATVDAQFQPNFGGATDLFLVHLGQDLGDACEQADECESLQCIDGVCCEQQCAGVCDVCSVAAGGVVDGTCALLPVDECVGTLPTLDWSTYAGASGAETRAATAVDAAGNIYLVGTTTSATGLATGGTHQFSYGGGPDDVFVLKFSSAGDRIWGTYLGGKASDQSTGIAVDALGRVLVVGSTLSTDAIASPDGLQTTSAGGREGFAVLLDPDGVRLWGTYLGSDGPAGDVAYAGAFDGAGDIYVAGDVQGAFPFELMTAHDDTPGGGTDAYLLALTPDGGLKWGSYYGAALADAGRGLAVDDDLGLVYLLGNTASPTDIATPGAFDETLDGPSDGFVAAFDQDGARQWGTYLGGDGTDSGAGGAVAAGGVVFVGTTDSQDQATPDAHQAALGGGGDALVVQLDSDGARIWATYYGGAGDDQGAAIAVNAAGSLLLTGTTTSSAGIASAAALQPDPLGGRDVFVAKLDAHGGRRWGTYFGGQADDIAGTHGVATFGVDVTYIAGHTASSVGVATEGALFQPALAGMTDLFLARLSHGQGDTCSADSECDTGFCVDGVCCDTACGGGEPGGCLACSVALGSAADGTCAAVVDATPCAAGVCMDGACLPDETSDSATDSTASSTDPTGDSGPGSSGGTGNSDSNSGGVDSGVDPSVPTSGDAGPGGDQDASGEGSGSDTAGLTDGGCGCATSPVAQDMSLGLLVLLALRRRRRA